jgi:mandelate racemase
MSPPSLRFRGLAARAVLVPLRRALVTSAGTLERVPLVLIDLTTEEGVTGHAYLFAILPRAAKALAALLEEAGAVAAGDPVSPFELGRKLAARFKLVGNSGLVSMALAGVDTACWDALAKAAGLPLVRLLGGVPKPVPAYNSNGLGLLAPEAVADEAEALLEGGFAAIKIRLGRPTLEQDLAAVRAVRQRIPESILLMSDFNQGLGRVEAVRRGRALDAEGLYWIEEPIRHDDYEGNALIARELATPVQIGENFIGPAAMAQAIAARAADYVMPDLQRIGGVSGWLKAAALAEAAELEMSTHLFPEVSAHLLAVTPTAHWLEYVDWAEPVLAERLEIADGMAAVPDRPGAGLAWDEGAVRKYLID